MKKTIDIAITAWPRTFARIQYLAESLRTFREFVSASRHEMIVRVSAETLDVSPDQFSECTRVCREYGAIPHWRAKPPSLGGNMNDALMLGHGQFILLAQDDWSWLESVDLSDDAEFLEHEALAFIRYATFFTEFITNVYPASGRYELVNMTGPYCYGDQPHLRRSDFATRRSSTGGKPIGFYKTADYADGDLNYSVPENEMQEHLRNNGWQIAAYNPNACEHNGSLSTDPARHPQPA